MTSTDTVRIEHAGTAVREFASDLVVAHRYDAADGVVVLDLADPAQTELPRWSPGAHIDLVLGDGLVRQYSLCGTPRDSESWRIGVLLNSDGRGGSRFVHQELVRGATVGVRGPRNHFPLVDSLKYFFIAGGIGITPMIPMIEAVARDGRAWSLLYSGRSASTMAFATELADTYGDRIQLWPNDTNGLFDIESALAEPQSDTLIYCCGPEPLLAAVEQHCTHWPDGSLHLERFAAKPQAESFPDALDAFEVECRRSGITVHVSGDVTVLEALEDADVPIMSSCLEGVCGTCEAGVLDGIPDHRDSMLTESERAAGNIMLTCVSRSRSQKLVLDV